MAFFDPGLGSFAGAEINWDSHQIRAILTDLDDAGPSAGAYKVTGATYSAPYVTITTQAAHGITAGDKVEVFSVGGITNVNGVFYVFDAPSTTTFRYVPSATPSGSYTSGGYIADLSLQYLSQFVPTAGRVSNIEIPTAGRSRTNGYLDCADLTFTGVPPPDPVEAFLVVKAATTPGGAQDADTAQRLILIQTPNTPGLTGLPQTPTNGNIMITIAAQGLGKI